MVRRDDAGLVLIRDGKAVREIQHVAVVQALDDFRPLGTLPGIRDQVLEHRRALGGLLEREERLPRNPAVGDGPLPARAALLLPDDDVDAVVAHVQGLGRALHAVAQHGHHLVLEHLACFFKRELLAGDDFFFHTAE